MHISPHLNSARGQYLVLGDADDTYDFLEIPKTPRTPEKRC